MARWLIVPSGPSRTRRWVRVLNVEKSVAGAVRLHISTLTVLMWGWMGADAEGSTFCTARHGTARYGTARHGIAKRSSERRMSVMGPKPKRITRLRGPTSPSQTDPAAWLAVGLER